MFWSHELREGNNIVKQVFPCLPRKFHNMWRSIFTHMHLEFMILLSPFCLNDADIFILAWTISRLCAINELIQVCMS